MPERQVLGRAIGDHLALEFDNLARTFEEMRSDTLAEAALLGTHSTTWSEELAMTGPRDVLLLFTLAPRPHVIEMLASDARTTRMNVVTVTDRRNVAHGQRFSRLAIGCHVASHIAMHSHTALQSDVRLLAVPFPGKVGDAALQRLAVVSDINAELGQFE